MDIDQVKENIQPLATGRNVSMLQSTLNMDPAQLLIEKRELEMQIRNYDGNDPLEPWCQYINWIEQSYPSSGKKAGLQEVLQKLLLHFENDERYYQDRRMVKLYIKLIENRKEPAECYKQLYNAGIGTMVADFYIAWAYCYDLVGNHVRADEIFRKGIECRAEPLEELKEAHQHFGFSVAQRIMHKDNIDVKEETNRQLNERRLALSSLRVYSRKQLVSSVRTGLAIKKATPGHVQVDKTLLGGQTSQKNNTSSKVFLNENDSIHITAMNASQYEEHKSVTRSIVDSIREQENVKEPGPWTGAVNSKKNKSMLFDKDRSKCNLNFEIYIEDDIMVPANEINVDKPFKYPANFIGKNASQEVWITPITTEEAPDKNTLPQYNKYMLYPRPNQEFSFEEYRAYKWMIKSKMENKFTEKRHEFWGSGPYVHCRLYPNFAKKSLPQELNELDEFYMPPKVDGLIMDYNDIYNAEEKIELQLEEILAHMYYMKHNQTIVGPIDMEETICEPSDNLKRSRKSFYPLRKSLEPAKYKLSISSTNQFDLKNKMKDIRCRDGVTGGTDEVKELQNDGVSKGNIELEWSKSQSKNQIDNFQFKMPMLVEAMPSLPSVDNCKTLSTPKVMVAEAVTDVTNSKRLPFEIFEDTVCKTITPKSSTSQKKNIYFDVDETCSTRAFSAFLKPNSVSTPMALAKQNPAHVFDNVLTDVKSMTVGTTKTTIKSIHIEEKDDNNEQKEYPDKRTPLQASDAIGYPTNESSEDISPPQKAFTHYLSPIMEIPEQGTTTATPTIVGTSMETDGAVVATAAATTITKIDQDSAEMNVKSIVTINSCEDVFKDSNTNSSSQRNSTPSEKSNISNVNELTTSIKHTETSNINEKKTSLPTIRVHNATTIPQAINIGVDSANVTSMPNNVVNNNQMGNITRLEQKENTITDLNLKQLSTTAAEQFVEQPTQSAMKSFFLCQQDKTETITNVNMLLNQEENISLITDNNSLFELLKPLSPPFQTTSNKMSYDDIVELFTLSPSRPIPSSSSSTTLSRINKWELSTNDTKINKDDKILTNTYLRDLRNVQEPPLPPSAPSTSSSFTSLPSMAKGTDPDIMKNMLMKTEIQNNKKNFNEQETPMSMIKKATSHKLEENEVNSDGIVKMELKETQETNLNYDIKNRDIKLKFLTSETAASSINKSSNYDKENVLHENAMLDDAIDIIDDSDDTSIYYKESPKSPTGERHQWNTNDLTNDNNDEYTHPISVYDDQQILDYMPLNLSMDPFDVEMRNEILQKIIFTKYIQVLPNCQMRAYIPQLRSKSTLQVNDTKFEILKLVAEGSYGTIFRAKNLDNGLMYALKQQKPPNNWEYYICLEVEDRLRINEMLPAFMTIDYALVANNASVLISTYSLYGSFITVCNHVKKCTTKNLNEYVVMLMANELLDIMDHLHSINIIHADIKADNFLLMNKLCYPAQYRAIKLIDFGVAIDMKTFDPNQKFKYIHKDKSIRCIEMREGRPWTYQLDLYGLAGVLHVLLFGKYMEVKKTDLGKWIHTTHVARYFHKTLWETIFNALLNIRDCHSMPNLQELRALLKQQIEEKITFVLTAITDFNMIISQVPQRMNA